ncbi:MAG: hypothetical protein RL885_24675 [Planctomycetota bacterium]
MSNSESGSIIELPLDIHPQPNDHTCGPTCLQAVYRYFGEDLELERVIAETAPLESGGTLAVFLANHALRRGYRATIYTYNLQLFDPAWFGSGVDLSERLRAQAAVKSDPKLQIATTAYLEFLQQGGRVWFEDLTPQVLERHLVKRQPILTGLSATYLYGCAREFGDFTLVYDDIRGEPTGHFVVLRGYDASAERVMVSDPYHENPLFRKHEYWLPVGRVVSAILLGMVSYDANLLVLEPPDSPEPTS